MNAILVFAVCLELYLSCSKPATYTDRETVILHMVAVSGFLFYATSYASVCCWDKNSCGVHLPGNAEFCVLEKVMLL